MSPILFNVFMFAVVHHWVAVMATTEAGTEGLGLSIRYLVAYFHSGNGLATSNQLEIMQRAFGVLVDLFGRVGIRKNTWKTVALLVIHATCLVGCWW